MNYENKKFDFFRNCENLKLNKKIEKLYYFFDRLNLFHVFDFANKKNYDKLSFKKLIDNVVINIKNII